MKKTIWQMFFALMLVCQASFVWAQTANVISVEPTDEIILTKDRFEKFNRDMFQFNEAWDQTLFKPVAKTYKKAVPSVIRTCAHNILDNFNMPYTAVNNVLQGKFKAAGQDMCRFVVNATVGLGGCMDVASKWNIPKHDEDFGQTLGVWGVPSGAFIMLPGLGPTTVRDALAKPVDFLADPVGYIKLIKLRNSMKGLRFVDARTSLLETLDFADDIALDKYALLRDTWLQSREGKVRDEDYEPDVAPLASAELPVSTAAQPEPELIKENAPKTPAAPAP